MLIFALFIMTLIAGLWLTAPLVARRNEPDELARREAEVSEYLSQISHIEFLADQPGADMAALKSQKRILQRHLLTSQRAAVMAQESQAPMRKTATVLFIALLVICGGIYATIGTWKTPNAGPVPAENNLNRTDQMDMITGMVESLSAKLDEDPSDIAGWTRLMRSRLVLGQVEQAKSDIDRMRAAFPDNPETIDQIMVDSGWMEALKTAPPSDP